MLYDMREKKNIIELTRLSVEEYKESAKLPLIVVADNVRSLHNVGSLFRTADSFGLAGIVLGGISGTPPHPELSKSALGAEESVDWIHVDSAYDYCVAKAAQGWKVLALEQAHDSVRLEELEIGPEDALVLVVGNEVTGVDQRIVSMASAVVELPMRGVTHSLNVSVSAGIAMYSLALRLGL